MHLNTLYSLWTISFNPNYFNCTISCLWLRKFTVLHIPVLAITWIIALLTVGEEEIHTSSLLPACFRKERLIGVHWNENCPSVSMYEVQYYRIVVCLFYMLSKQWRALFCSIFMFYDVRKCGWINAQFAEVHCDCLWNLHNLQCILELTHAKWMVCMHGW